MNKEVAALIKTLNGGLKHLPDLAQQMVHQYVVGHAVLSALELIATFLLLLGAFYVGKKVWNLTELKNHNQTALKRAERAMEDAQTKAFGISFGSVNDEEDKRREQDYQEKINAYEVLSDSMPSETSIIILTVLLVASLTFGLMMLLTGTIDLYRALTPIWSIISALKG